MIRIVRTSVRLALLETGAVLLLLLAQACSTPTQPTQKPALEPPPSAMSFSGHIPLDVTFPPNVTPEQERPFLDTFSWQEFVALNWPAADAPRGAPKQPDNPSVFLNAASGAQPVVWGTYKEDFELFDQGANRPAAWNSNEIPVNPCGNVPISPGQRIFVRYSKGDSVVEIGNQAFSYPLIDQKLNYAVYEIRFNEAQYNFIRGTDGQPKTFLYLVKNLAAAEPVEMPESSPPSTQGAIMLKAAWKILVPGVDDAGRYYAVNSLVLDPDTHTCNPRQVGLIGFHIAQKLKKFPEWIWSTFEQVDNVPPASGPVSGQTYSFNNGSNSPPTIGGYANRPPFMAPKLQPVSQRKPVQVTRLNPVPESTAQTNSIWQQALKGTVWEHYQLVMTQWPFNAKDFKTPEDGGKYPQDAGGAFPVNGVTNSVMETYFQSQRDAEGAGGNSCMSCHYQAAKAGFTWSLLRGAHN
ncbi:MAG: hypothetical protein LAQ69_06745 [Acidobacteriia bacterium]|nr:hypothetical protein [Terriglobia bacterium]